MALRYEWSPLGVEDAESLFQAQNEFVAEHEKLTRKYSGTSFDTWKTTMGYPLDDKMRLEFIRNMATFSTKHGKSLHCLKLTRYQGDVAITAGFIDFEVRGIKDDLTGNVREIYIRSIIVFRNLRRQGCGRKLYSALFQYLSPGELDVIRLYVVDLNLAAINFYFKLGFRMTQWFLRELGDAKRKRKPFKAVFLCMQKLRGDRPGAMAISLQNMPAIFAEQVIGHVIHVDSSDGEREWVQRAVIKDYDSEKQLFSIAYLEDGKNKAEDGVDNSIHDVDVNFLYSSGQLVFEKPPSTWMNNDAVPKPGALKRLQSVAATKIECAEPSLWPRSRLVSSPLKGSDLTPEKVHGPSKKALVWPVSPPKNKPKSMTHCLALVPDKKPSVLDVKSADSTGNCFAIVPFLDSISTPALKKRVLKGMRQASRAQKAAAEFEFGYSEGVWQKGGVIDFPLVAPDGKKFKATGKTAIQFQQDNPKAWFGNSFKTYEKYRVATTIYEFCILQGPKRTRTEVLRDLSYDVSRGYCKVLTGKKAYKEGQTSTTVCHNNTLKIESNAKVRRELKVDVKKEKILRKRREAAVKQREQDRKRKAALKKKATRLAKLKPAKQLAGKRKAQAKQASRKASRKK